MKPRDTGLVAEPSAKRDAILAAALELFSERSFAGTPVPQVASRAGVGAGTIYRYFASKEDLANAVYQRCQRDLRAALASGVPPNLSPRQEFRWLWCGLWEFSSRRPRAFRFLETHHHATYLDAASLESRASAEEPISDFARRAQRAGAMREAPPELLLSMVLGAFVGLFKAADTGRIELSPEILARSEEAAWEMVRA
jgi:AcrR family transcriptional regulator